MENVFKARQASGSAPVFQDGRVRIAARQLNKTVQTRRTMMEVRSYLLILSLIFYLHFSRK
jgi:hypothetical protein